MTNHLIDIRSGVLFLTQAWVLLKQKFPQLNIFIMGQFYLKKVNDYSKSLLSCKINILIMQGSQWVIEYEVK